MENFSSRNLKPTVWDTPLVCSVHMQRPLKDERCLLSYRDDGDVAENGWNLSIPSYHKDGIGDLSQQTENNIQDTDQSKQTDNEENALEVENGEDEVDMACIRPKDHEQPYIELKVSDGDQDILQTMTLSWTDLLFIIISLGTFLFDVGSDLWVVVIYFQEGDRWYFGVTLTCVLTSSVVMTVFSLIWYIQDGKDNSTAESTDKKDDQPVKWIPRAIFLFLQLAPVLRYIDSMVYCCRNRQAKTNREKHRWYDCLVQENADSCLLRLMECFLESAPQLTLQLYIIQKDGLKPVWHQATVQLVVCITSMISLSWAVASYQKALRKSLHKCAKLTCTSMMVMLLWRLFTIGSRVLALALLVFLINKWAIPVLFVHWLIMFFWVFAQDSPFCEQKCQKFFFNIVMALVYMFAYLNLQAGRTRLRYLFYYGIVYTENLAIAISWCVIKGKNMDLFHVYTIIVITVGFFLGIAFQALYYLKFHPRNYPPWSDEDMTINICVDWSEVHLIKPRHARSEQEVNSMIDHNSEDNV